MSGFYQFLSEAFKFSKITTITISLRFISNIPVSFRCLCTDYTHRATLCRLSAILLLIYINKINFCRQLIPNYLFIKGFISIFNFFTMFSCASIKFDSMLVINSGSWMNIPNVSCQSSVNIDPQFCLRYPSSYTEI